jgi:hypothetical protein
METGSGKDPHHTEDPLVLLREAAWVACHIILTDHFLDRQLAKSTLRFIDPIGKEAILQTSQME